MAKYNFTSLLTDLGYEVGNWAWTFDEGRDPLIEALPPEDFEDLEEGDRALLVEQTEEIMRAASAAAQTNQELEAFGLQIDEEGYIYPL